MADEPLSTIADTQLMQRITILMEEKQLFKVSDLKVSDIANELRTNARYVSDCIKLSTNYSFTQYVNFRAFKAITGMTPKDWKNLQND